MVDELAFKGRLLWLTFDAWKLKLWLSFQVRSTLHLLHLRLAIWRRQPAMLADDLLATWPAGQEGLAVMPVPLLTFVLYQAGRLVRAV